MPRLTLRTEPRKLLGLLWLLDGLLQFQPAMLTPKFAVKVIAAAGAGEPVAAQSQPPETW